MKLSPDRPAAARTRLMLVEDQTSIREMLSEVISRRPEFEVVAESAEVEEALLFAGQARPDVVVLDWCFPGGGGRAFLEGMRARRIFSHVLVLTGHTTEEAVGEALAYGARGFFDKTGNLEEFFRAVRAVVGGGAYFGPEASVMVERLLRAKQLVAPSRETAAAGSGFLGVTAAFPTLGFGAL